jgi:hypothetical protein
MILHIIDVKIYVEFFQAKLYTLQTVNSFDFSLKGTSRKAYDKNELCLNSVGENLREKKESIHAQSCLKVSMFVLIVITFGVTIVKKKLIFLINNSSYKKKMMRTT